jgi:enterochelin esterase-like enzyme
MVTRQATFLFIATLLLVGLAACSSSPNLPTPTVSPSPTSTQTPLPVPTLPSATPTQLTCLDQPGQLRAGQVPTNGAPTNFIIYLPPCYEYFHEWRYPVLYLLNGQPFEHDPDPPGTQWIRIGAPAAADALIQSGEYPPFIIVFPEDRYWNVVQGTLFGQFMVNDIIPYIDQSFRTIADPPHRAIGGLSRGGGWAMRLGLFQTDLFGSVGLHSPAIFVEERANLIFLIKNRATEWPRLYIDTGQDAETAYNASMEAVFTQYNIPHEWHLNVGEHTLAYWSRHALEYLTWYAEGFQTAGDPLPTPTPTATFIPSPALTPEPSAASTPATGSTSPTAGAP